MYAEVFITTASNEVSCKQEATVSGYFRKRVSSIDITETSSIDLKPTLHVVQDS